MSAFPNTGHWEVAKLENLSGCFRPEADIGAPTASMEQSAGWQFLPSVQEEEN